MKNAKEKSVILIPLLEGSDIEATVFDGGHSLLTCSKIVYVSHKFGLRFKVKKFKCRIFNTQQSITKFNYKDVIHAREKVRLK